MLKNNTLTNKTVNMKNIIYICVIGLLLFSCNQVDKDTYQEIPEVEYAVFDADNNLIRPKGYRSWVFAGTGTTPKVLDNNVLFPDHQNIYIDPAGFKYWKEHGEWKEGTIFVKELVRAGDTVSPVGKGFFHGDYYSISAMVKDSKRFPEMHNGWNYFGFVDKQNYKITNSAKPLGMKCASCHIPNAIDGDVFYQYYPVILGAKGFGKGNPEDADTRKGLVPDYTYERPTSEYLKKYHEGGYYAPKK